MTLYFGIKFHADLRHRGFVEALLTRLEQQGHKTLFVQRDVEQWGQTSLHAAKLMTQTFMMLDDSDVVVIDLSEKGVGLGIEAGYAFAHAKPIITVVRRGAVVSTTLQGISAQVLFYDDADDLTRQLTRALNQL